MKEEHKHKIHKVEISYCRADCVCGAWHGISVWQNEDGYQWELNSEKWSELPPPPESRAEVSNKIKWYESNDSINSYYEVDSTSPLWQAIKDNIPAQKQLQEDIPALLASERKGLEEMEKNIHVYKERARIVEEITELLKTTKLEQFTVESILSIIKQENHE